MRSTSRSRVRAWSLYPLVSEAGEHLGRRKALAPLIVERCSWLGRDGLVDGLSLLLQVGHFLANRGEHVQRRGELLLVADRAVTGNYDGRHRPRREIALRRVD